MSGQGQLVFSYYNKRNAHRVLHYPEARKHGDPFTHESAEISSTMIAHHPATFGALLREAGFSAPKYQGAVVVDSVAKMTDRLGRPVPAGTGWAPFMGRLRLAPWLVGRSAARGDGELLTAESVDELFACPVCKGALDRADEGFSCPSCRRDYPIDTGIYDFRS